MGSTDIVPHRAGRLPVVRSTNSPEWERLWFAIRRKDWRTLALVPAGPGVPSGFTLDVAMHLVRVGEQELGMPIVVVDASQVSLMHMSELTNELASVVRMGGIALLALAPIQENPTTLPLAQSADKALLCAPLNRVKLGDTKRTIDQIGPKAFVGSVAFSV